MNDAPALQILLALEESPRVLLVAGTYDEQLRLAAWLGGHPAWLEAVELLLGCPLDLLAPAPDGKLRGAV